MKRNSTKYILSDLDGVIRHFPAERRQFLEKRFNLPEGAIDTAAFEKDILTKVVCGKISDEIWRDEIARSLSKLIPTEVAKDLVRKWSNFSGIVDQDYLETSENHFHGLPLAILTNATSRLNTEIFFIDDSLSHVHAAQKLGIKYHHYTSLRNFRESLTGH